MFLDIISNFKNIRVLFRAGIDFIKSVKSINNKRYTLAFRDLNNENILMQGSTIFLVDCGRLSMTIYGYDLECIGIMSCYNDIYRKVFKRLNYKQNLFLSTHSLIHHAYSFSKTPNRHVEKLYELYEKRKESRITLFFKARLGRYLNYYKVY